MAGANDCVISTVVMDNQQFERGPVSESALLANVLREGGGGVSKNVRRLVGYPGPATGTPAAPACRKSRAR